MNHINFIGARGWQCQADAYSINHQPLKTIEEKTQEKKEKEQKANASAEETKKPTEQLQPLAIPELCVGNMGLPTKEPFRVLFTVNECTYNATCLQK